MPEIRTTSSTGGQKGVKDERHDLIPRKGVAAIARVFAFGAQKYADHNWRRGYEWSKSIAALDRHFGAFVDGETYDPESGLPHLAHAGFHVLVLLTWLEEQGEGVDNLFDDRWVHSMERARREEEEVNLGRPVVLPDPADVDPDEVHVLWRDPEPMTQTNLRPYMTAMQKVLSDLGTWRPPRTFTVDGNGQAVEVVAIEINPDAYLNDHHDGQLRDLLQDAFNRRP